MARSSGKGRLRQNPPRPVQAEELVRAIAGFLAGHSSPADFELIEQRGSWFRSELLELSQEILEGRARSARRLAIGKHRLRRELEEVVDSLPDDALVGTAEAEKVEELLEVAEAALEQRDEEAARLRADLEDALAELQTYEEQLAVAEARLREAEAASRTAERPKGPPSIAAPPLPARIGNREIVASRRFNRELDALPPHLRPFVSARLRLLLEQPAALERRAYLVDEPDRLAYRLPRSDGLRKCRLNVKHRMFLVVHGDQVELVAVAKHA